MKNDDDGVDQMTMTTMMKVIQVVTEAQVMVPDNDDDDDSVDRMNIVMMMMVVLIM